MDAKEMPDRQFEAVLERLDRLCDEVSSLNRRLDRADQLDRMVRELQNLNESLQALAYAALGHAGPQVRRRRTG
jgi:predicted nuclease with TOPRIM domain